MEIFPPAFWLEIASLLRQKIKKLVRLVFVVFYAKSLEPIFEIRDYNASNPIFSDFGAPKISIIGVQLRKSALNSVFLRFGAMPATQNEQFLLFLDAHFPVLFRKNVCLGTVEVPTMVQKRRGQNDVSFFRCFLAFSR